jgi:hypothetical protein
MTSSSKCDKISQVLNKRNDVIHKIMEVGYESYIKQKAV